jgi:hypothetical protein
MTLNIPAEEIAPKDYSTSYGTVTEVTENKDGQGNVISYNITFFNGTILSGVSPDAEFELVQGGLTDHGPQGSIRAGLAADHAEER